MWSLSSRQQKRQKELVFRAPRGPLVLHGLRDGSRCDSFEPGYVSPKRTETRWLFGTLTTSSLS